jgi:hypothetical protein
MRRRAWETVFVALVAAIMFAGCQDTAGPPPREISKSELDQLDEAEAKLTAQCMRQRGFELYVKERPEPRREFPYGNADPGFARQHGLGFDTGTIAQAVANNPNKTYVDKLPASRRHEYAEALDGASLDLSVTAPNGYTAQKSSQGCVADAQRRLYGDLERWFRVSTLVEQLANEVSQSVHADSRYRHAVEEWARCMATRGYIAASPGALRAQYESAAEQRRDERGEPGPIPLNEISAALAEVHCANRSDLPQVGSAVFAEHHAAVQTRHRELIDEQSRLQMAALDRAASPR